MSHSIVWCFIAQFEISVSFWVETKGYAMPDLPKSGSRLISSPTFVARIRHYCSNEQPECSCHIIFPGDLYIREISLHWVRSHDNTISKRVEIKKFHYSPACHPDPKWFEDESATLTTTVPLPLAA
jgi:hypothetical protein